MYVLHVLQSIPFLVQVPDLFAGLMLDDLLPSTTSTTATTLQPTPIAAKTATPEITATGTQPSPQLNRPGSEPLKAIVIPAQSSTSRSAGQPSQIPTSKPLSTASNLSSLTTGGYTPPPLRPQKPAGSGLGDLDLLSSQPAPNMGIMQPQRSGTGTNWSSDIAAPTSSTGLAGLTGLSGLGSSNSSQMASGSSGLFSGMQVSPVPGQSPLNPIPMQPSSGSLPMQQQQQQSSGGSFMTPTPYQGHMPVSTNQNAYGGVGMGQGLVPTPAQPQQGLGGSLGNAASEWSPNIQAQSLQSGLNPQPQAPHTPPTAWSSTQPQLSGSHAGAGWSSNIAGQGTQGGTGMGLMQNPGTNWSSSIQTGQGLSNQQHGSLNAAGQGMATPQQLGPSVVGGGGGGWSATPQGGGAYSGSGGLGATYPPTAGSLMMGNGGQTGMVQQNVSLLQPQQAGVQYPGSKGQQTGMVPQNVPMLQPQQAGVQYPGSKPAPGDNPFADLSFLS